jgi:hypothetical protein
MASECWTWYSEPGKLHSVEVLMADQAVATPLPLIAPEVQAFAAQRGVSRYLAAAVDLARQAFPAAALSVSLGEDAEDEAHRYVALDVEVGGMSAAELLAAQRAWSAGLSGVCPSHDAVYFVLGWR